MSVQVIAGPLAQMSKEILALTGSNQLLIDRQSLTAAFPLAPSDRAFQPPPSAQTSSLAIAALPTWDAMPTCLARLHHSVLPPRLSLAVT